jgi:hypothetical protein
MGKEAKKHRAKVAKRNAKVKEQKSGMQKAFDMLVQQQLENLKNDDLTAKMGDKEIDMEVIEDRVIDHAFKFIPNEEESEKINKEFNDETSVEQETSEIEK